MTSDAPRTRPFGIRASLGKNFIAALETDFANNAGDVIEKVRGTRPYDYLRIVVSLLPEEVLAEKSLDDMTDDEIGRFIDDVRSFIDAKSNTPSGEQE